MHRYILPLVACSLGACSVGPRYQPPDISLTHQYMGASQIAAEAPPDGIWWAGFRDPLLSRIIGEALVQNLDIAVAMARLQQSRAAAQFAGAALLPQGNLATSASEERLSLNTPIGQIAHAFGAARDYQVYSLGAEASWELDAFGGTRHARDAARAEEQSDRLNEAAVRIMIAAETADAYLALRGLQERMSVARLQENNERELVDLIDRRYHQGVSSDRELHRVIGELERVRASEAPLQRQIDAQLNRLDVLMGAQAGTYRGELEQAQKQPIAPAPIGNPDPAVLLRSRPDVRAAERRLMAANARIGSAIAEYYPHLSLSALLGVASTGTSSLFVSAATQGEGLVGLRWRLFDFGRVDAEVSLARGREAQSLAEYRQTVLRATEDVENALSGISNSTAEANALERQIEELTRARDQTRMAYQNGVLSLIDVLDADRELLDASDRLAVAKADRARASVASYRALGGGWIG